MNITFLAGYFTPEKSADTHLNDDLVKDLAKNGANVKVIVPFPSRGLSEEQKQYYEGLREEKIGNDLTVYRVGERTDFKQGLISRGLGFVKKTWLLYKESKKYETDCYFVVSTPPFLGYLAKSLAKRAPVVYKLQDVFPDNLIEIKGLSEKNPIVKVLRRMEKGVYRSASKILVCSENVKATLMSRGVEAEKLVVIHDWVDENSCVPIDRKDNILFDEYKVDRSKFTFTYAGNIGHMQNVNTILDAAKILKEKGIDAQILIIGDGALREHIDERIAKEDISNVIRLPMQPLERVSMVYSSGDVGLISLKAGVAKTALPSKTWSNMSAARPVICEIDGDCELVSILREENCGICVEPGDHIAMAEAMLKMYNMQEEERLKMGASCRDYIVNKVSRSISTGKYFSEIEKTVAEHNKKAEDK